MYQEKSVGLNGIRDQAFVALDALFGFRRVCGPFVFLFGAFR